MSTARGGRAVLVAALAAAVLSGSAASAGPRAAAADTVVFAVPADVVGGFNGFLACCNGASTAYIGVTEALRGAYSQNDQGEWVADLVTRASASRTGLTYTIRPKAFWYWGGRRLPVTYRDFVYTLQQIDDPKNDVTGRAGYANLDPTRFTHKGDRQVTFFWRTSGCSTDRPCGPYANWQSLFGTLYPAAALAGLDFNTIWTDCICGNDGKPVASGPFYLSKYTRGQGSTLLRNPYWGGTKPTISRIVFEVIPDVNLQVEAMRSGSVDALFSLAFDQNLLALKAPGIAVDVGHSNSLEHLVFREGDAKGGPSVHKGSSNVLLRAPWMRQAIALALDRQAIIRALLPGSGIEPVDSLLFFPTQSNYRPDFARWSYDPARAVALLKKHCTGGPSAPNPNNKSIWQCAGLPATFRWTWRANSAPRTQLEALAKADLQSVGIALSERPLASNVFFGPDGISAGDFDIANYSLGGSGDPGDWYDIYRCAGESNYTGYCSHTVDALLNAANGELDPARRAELFRHADAILATQVPTVPLYESAPLLVHKSGLVGMHAGPNPFWNVEEWRWKR